MFGSDWEPATARIVAKKFKEGGERSGVWEYVADIMPASGAPAFRAKLSQPHLMSHVVWLAEGAEVRAFADVKHQKAKFDRDDPVVNGKAKRGAADRFDEALTQPPLTPPPAN